MTERMTEHKFASGVMRVWMRRGWLAYLAWPLAQLFGGVLQLRAFLYRTGWLKRHKLAVPVIVVGNIFVGGTGKTPLSLWLAGKLTEAGYHPGLISRGYGRKHDAPCIVSANSKATEAGDEPLLLAQRGGCPVVVGRNRVSAGKLLLSHFPDVSVIISDDGLQHTALARDIEIMLFDSRGVGNGWLLPAGPLRELPGRRRDVTVVNLSADESIGAELPLDSWRMELKGTRAHSLTDPSQIRELSSLPGDLKIIAVAGIGNPERFFTLLRKQGVMFLDLPLPDHFDYDTNPFKNLVADMILITEKDAVKCRQVIEIANDSRVWVVPVEADIAAGLFKKIQKILEKLN